MAKGPVAKSLADKLQEMINAHVRSDLYRLTGTHAVPESHVIDEFSKPLADKLETIANHHHEPKLEE